MEVSVINIGNSKGIILSRALLKKYRISDKVELVMKKGYIVLKPRPQVRTDWDTAFRLMHNVGDDKLLIDDVFDDE
jgi:antitoxin MazE